MGHEASGVHLVEEELFALLDGELESGARRAAEGHLAGCPACAGRLAEARSLFARIESLPELTPGRDLSRPVLRSLRRSGNSLPVLGMLGVQSLAAVALLWAASERVTRLVAPLAQLGLPAPVIAGWASLVGALWAVRLPTTGFHLDAGAWLPRLSERLPAIRPAPDWILWGLLVVGVWLLVNTLVLGAERERRIQDA